jgi:hypothetical protein
MRSTARAASVHVPLTGNQGGAHALELDRVLVRLVL